MTEEHAAPVKAKAVLVDAASLDVLWANESATVDMSSDAAAGEAVTLDRLVPVEGIMDAAHQVARSGRPAHLRTSLVSMSRGKIAVATSIYRLPDGTLLVLSEYAWQPVKRRT
jgi:hypothetical protein